MSLLKWFGITVPKQNKFDIRIDDEIRKFHAKHAEAVECLVCKMVDAGNAPQDLEIVQEHNSYQLGFTVRVRRKDR